MALIAYPGSKRHRSVGLGLIAASQTNRSEFTFARQAQDLGTDMYRAVVSITPMEEEEAGEWSLFFEQLRGSTHTFHLPVAALNQHEGPYSVLSSAIFAAGLDSIAVDGLPPNTTLLKTGRLVTVNDQLMRLSADLTSDGLGDAVMSFSRALREEVPNNTLVTTKLPYLNASLPADSPLIYLDEGKIIKGFEFEAVEAF